MSTFSDPIYELTGITNNFCFFDGIGLVEFDNIINDSGYTYSGLTLVVDFTGFTSHFDTTGHTYSNVILSNDVYTYTGFTNEIHYFEINDIYSGYTPYIDPLFGSLTESEVIDGFTTDIISCTEKLDGLTGTCCSTQQILSNLPVIVITNEGGGSDNCDDFIARRTPEGWTLDFVFNKNGDTGWTESVFWFTGVRDEYETENYADNGLSFRFTSDGKIIWTAYRFSGYCDTTSGYTEMFYIQSGGTTNALCSGGTSSDFSVIITFERFNVYEDECDLANQGGWNDLIWTGTTEALTKKWTDERNKRLGVLKIYHNGKPIYKLKGFEETVLSDRGYQPFTHVIGGGVTGSSGIHEGTFCYSIKQAAYYEEPMTFLEVQDHYNTDISSDFTINDCSSPCADVIVMVTPSPTPTVTKTPSVTPTITRTPSITPTITRTPSITPTITRTPSVTPTPVAINSVYGLLYNGDAMSDARGVVASGWHVPTNSDFDTLINNLGGTLVAGGEAKESGYTYWNSPNVGATNSSGFSGRGAGRRLTSGTFERILENEYFWTSTLWGGDIYNIVFLSYTNATFGSSTSETERGLSIRPVKDSTTLTHGQMGTYTGNDGQIYRTIAIGTGTTQEWLVGNLAETQYQNGDIITEIREASIWSGLTSPACCAYDNNWAYVPGVAPTPTPSMTPSVTVTPSPDIYDAILTEDETQYITTEDEDYYLEYL